MARAARSLVFKAWPWAQHVAGKNPQRQTWPPWLVEEVGTLPPASSTGGTLAPWALTGPPGDASPWRQPPAGMHAWPGRAPAPGDSGTRCSRAHGARTASTLAPRAVC